jgi:uncharacterized protein (DUF1810 family)
MTADPADGLERFVAAQEAGHTYEHAIAELRDGRKRSHWMWFVFPQIAGLGFSETSRYYAIASLEEAQAYLAHPVLGARLRECAQVLVELPDSDPVRVFGGVDAQKLQSSMTLFLRAAPREQVFARVLEKYFGAAVDATTDQLL